MTTATKSVNQKCELSHDGVRILLAQARTKLVTICRDLGIRDVTAARVACWRGSKRGRAGEVRRMIVSALHRRIANYHLQAVNASELDGSEGKEV